MGGAKITVRKGKGILRQGNLLLILQEDDSLRKLGCWIEY
jgi:hypothetical protein